MAKKQLNRTVTPTKDEVVEAWGATPFTNHPVIQPHEVDDVEADFQTASACGMDNETAADYVIGQLKSRRMRDFIAYRAIQSVHRQRSRNGAAVVNADHVELHSQYQPEIDRLMEHGAQGGMSYTKAKETVRKKFGVSATTVRNHTTNKWPRKPGRPKKN